MSTYEVLEKSVPLPSVTLKQRLYAVNIYRFKFKNIVLDVELDNVVRL